MELIKYIIEAIAFQPSYIHRLHHHHHHRRHAQDDGRALSVGAKSSHLSTTLFAAGLYFRCSVVHSRLPSPCMLSVCECRTLGANTLQIVHWRHTSTYTHSVAFARTHTQADRYRLSDTLVIMGLICIYGSHSTLFVNVHTKHTQTGPNYNTNT